LIYEIGKGSKLSRKGMSKDSQNTEKLYWNGN
jgi:hypothetical protein